MKQKSEFLCLLKVLILCTAILIPFVSNGGIISQKGENELSSPEITTVDYSWSSWYNEYDRDSDGVNDTIKIWYEFANLLIY